MLLNSYPLIRMTHSSQHVMQYFRGIFYWNSNDYFNRKPRNRAHLFSINMFAKLGPMHIQGINIKLSSLQLAN